MRTLLFLLFSLMVWQCGAQSYAVTDIPAPLLKNAHAVKRFEELKIVVRDKGHARIFHTYAITVLNEAGERFARFASYYDKFTSIREIDGALYDAAGKRLQTVRKKDISDMAHDDGMSIVNDTRIKSHQFYYRSYPYTVEYHSEEEVDGIFQLPVFRPMDGFNMSVQQARLVLVTPSGYGFKTKMLNLHLKPEQKQEGSQVTYTWQTQAIPAMERQPFQPSFAETSPSIYVRPDAFELAGYAGRMDTWQAFGTFVAQLNQGRDALPEPVKADVQRLTAGLTSREEKVKALYQYLQQNTRYILVALGLGGWQPYDAKYVAEKKYGDCKALSNFMVSLLKEAGIPSYYALIRAGYDEPPIWEDFASPYFNHATVCVPNGKDSIWLECTDQTKSAGFLGSFTGDRKALLITEDGGRLVSTRYYSCDDNLQRRRVDAVVSPEGHLRARVRTLFRGIQQEPADELIHLATEKEKQEFLNKAISLPTYQVLRSHYTQRKGYIPEIDEELELTAQHFANVSGTRLFIVPNLFNKSRSRLQPDTARTMPFRLAMNYRDIDSVYIDIPAGYEPESRPKDVKASSDFGQYQISYSVEGNRLLVVRQLEIYRNTYPGARYRDFVEFMNLVYRSDRGQLVFKKSTP